MPILIDKKIKLDSHYFLLDSPYDLLRADRGCVLTDIVSVLILYISLTVEELQLNFFN
ncbi:hypothetical protein LguiB_031994 [Lonicera macranthoides]